LTSALLAAMRCNWVLLISTFLLAKKRASVANQLAKAANGNIINSS
jgi:hypothetical protein